jgi:hypothetical protein
MTNHLGIASFLRLENCELVDVYIKSACAAVQITIPPKRLSQCQDHGSSSSAPRKISGHVLSTTLIKGVLRPQSALSA